ncbi:MAG: hypothetical protein MAG551_00773 [Candidatus Scalindua arabica]|uniref:Uncharacterized protein n=1 Tax=Candidatus Scalindua arabica TaxID=1127984 RepID=A0A941ZZ08_9BACT|nr:hypothetical protein [Candidatus Scalindua arabica]
MAGYRTDVVLTSGIVVVMDRETGKPTTLKSGGTTICHKPGTPAEKTMEADASALDAHLGHGDSLGACSVGGGDDDDDDDD